MHRLKPKPVLPGSGCAQVNLKLLSIAQKANQPATTNRESQKEADLQGKSQILELMAKKSPSGR